MQILVTEPTPACSYKRVHEEHEEVELTKCTSTEVQRPGKTQWTLTLTLG